MKKFKITISLLLCICTLCLFSGATLADSSSTTFTETSSGQATLDMWYTDPTFTNCFLISNITDNPIDVSIILYKEDGTLLTDDGSNTSGFVMESIINNISRATNYSDKNSDSTVKFTLAAHNSIGILLASSKTTTYGYGIIKWTQRGSILHGLVANARCAYANGDERCSATESINNGLPF